MGFPAQSLGLGPGNTTHFQEHHAEVTPIAFRHSSSGQRTQLVPLRVCTHKVHHTVVFHLLWDAHTATPEGLMPERSGSHRLGESILPQPRCCPHGGEEVALAGRL